MSKSKSKEFSIVCLTSFSIVIGCFIFCRGFLLNRQVFLEKSSPCQNGGHPSISETHSSVPAMDSFCRATEPAFSNAIFILLDAFRYDFIHRMPFLSNIVQRGGKENFHSETQNRKGGQRLLSCAFKFIADPPTTTMQRLKALMSGTMPTFIDASANFNSYEVGEDNIIYQMHAAGKKIAFLGDDTWLSLFSRSLFTPLYVEAHPSFDAWDLDTVDRAVNVSLVRLLGPDHRKNWDVLIAHLLGVDHCGHRYGPSHPEMARKLNEADKTIEYVFNHMPGDTLLVVFGDHGMTKSGDHGGDSSNEVEAGIVFITKQSEAANSPAPPFQCHSKLNNPSSVSQIDLAPTISQLLGLPIPFSSIGQIFPTFLPSPIYSEAIMNNVAQVYRFVTEYAAISNAELLESYNEVMRMFKEYTLEKNATTTERLHHKAEWYLSSVKRQALRTWTQFDMETVYWGLGIAFMAIFSITCTISSHFVRKVHWSLPVLSSAGLISVLLNFFLESVFGLTGIKVMTTIGLVLLIILSTSLNGTRSHTSQNPASTSPISSGGLGSLSSILIYFFTCVAVFSNSFVINEGLVLGSVLMAAACLHVLLHSFARNEFQPNLVIKKSRGFLVNKKILIWRSGVHTSWISLLCLAAMVRILSLFFRCREELTECQEVFLLHKHSTSLPEDWVVYKCIRFGIALLSVAIFVVTFREWMMLRECLSSSRRPTALIGKYVPTILIVLTGAHWALEGLPFSIPHMVVIRPALGYFPLVYQTMTIAAIFLVWVQPLSFTGFSKQDCQESEGHNENEIPPGNAMMSLNSKGKKFTHVSKNGLTSVHVVDPLILKDNSVNPKKNMNRKEGLFRISALKCHQDVFTCSLLINCVLVILLLIQVTSTGITPAIVMIPYVIISILNLSVDASSQGSWSIIVIWTLASQYFFYCSGHQSVFSSIPWDSAFIGSSEGLGSSGSNSWISWIRPGLAVLGNLHVSQIIFSTALPLLVYWKGHAVPETFFSRNEMSRVYSIGGRFIILHSVKLLACMLCATLHRRHLMVWKIFAPKLIFEIISFLVLLISTILSLLFVTRVDHHYQKMLAKERGGLEEGCPSNP